MEQQMTFDKVRKELQGKIKEAFQVFRRGRLSDGDQITPVFETISSLLKDFCKHDENNYNYRQGAVVSLDVENKFMVMLAGKNNDDMQYISLPILDETEDILKEVGEGKKQSSQKTIYYDILAYEQGKVEENELEAGLMFIPSGELSLWSCIEIIVSCIGQDGSFKTEDINTLYSEKYFEKVKNTYHIPGIDELSDPNKILFFLGFLGQEDGKTDVAKTKRWMDFTDYVSGLCTDTIFYSSCINDEERDEEFFKKFKATFNTLTDTLGKGGPSEIKQLRKKLTEYKKLYSPRFSVWAEMHIGSFDPNLRSLIFSPKTAYFDGEEYKITSYFIGTCAHRSWKDVSGIDAFKKFREIIFSVIDLYEMQIQGVLRRKLQKNKLELKALAEKSARAAVMARNMSHNLGSHVLYQLSKNAMREKKYNLSRVFDYLAERMEFIAQYFTTDKPVVEGVYNFREFFDHFVVAFTAHANGQDKTPGSHFLRQMNDCDSQDDAQNFILKYLVASEGFHDICFSRECPNTQNDEHLCCHTTPLDRSTKIANCLCHGDNVGSDKKNVCFKLDFGEMIRGDSNGKNIIFRKGDEDSDDGLIPYSIIKGEGRLQDVTVSIPGGVIGSQAFYVILENFIRNTAKHADFGAEKRLRLSLIICESNEDSGSYVLVMTDNVTQIRKGQISEVRAIKEDDLDVKFNKHLQNGLVDIDSNEIIYGNWGLKEMQICAFFLAGRNIHQEIRQGRYPQDGDYGIRFGRDGKGLLTLEMKLRKPKLLSVVGEDGICKNKKKELEQVGISCFQGGDISLDEFYRIHNSQIVVKQSSDCCEINTALPNYDARKRQLLMGATSFRELVDESICKKLNDVMGTDKTDMTVNLFKVINQKYIDYLKDNYSIDNIDEATITFKNNPGSDVTEEYEQFGTPLEIGFYRNGKLTPKSLNKLKQRFISEGSSDDNLKKIASDLRAMFNEREFNEFLKITLSAKKRKDPMNGGE